MVGGLTAKADAHYKRDVSSILPIPESPQGVQALDDGGSVAGRQRESWLFLAGSRLRLDDLPRTLRCRAIYFTLSLLAVVSDVARLRGVAIAWLGDRELQLPVLRRALVMLLQRTRPRWADARRML